MRLVFDAGLLSRCAAISLAAIVLIGLIEAFAFPAIGAWQSFLFDYRRAQKELAHLQVTTSDAANVKQQLDQIENHPFWKKLYTESNAELALISMTKDFRDLAQAQRLQIDTIVSMQPMVHEGLTKIGIRVGFNAQMDPLAHLLLSMDAAARPLFIDNLYITSPINQQASANPAMVVRADVYAYWRGLDRQ